jgi:alkanesulfonate monooxygenase SsuD/methylene tetrahydromethanopterin reductase-like flavin-dependent oxidoreductase (luciferase family)
MGVSVACWPEPPTAPRAGVFTATIENLCSAAGKGRETVQFGAHLPLIDLGTGLPKVDDLIAYARRARETGFRYLCANDHFVFTRPWLDGPTALAAVVTAAGDLTIATTVALPTLRGTVQTAQLLRALHTLSGGRLVAGLGPGSSTLDYHAAGVPFAERWRRFDEAVPMLRQIVHQEPDPPPLWIASWGSPAGLRRAATLGDGWMASAYNTTPDTFATALDRLARAGRPPAQFPHAIATTWLYITDSTSTADHILDEVLAPTLGRTADQLRAAGLPIGPAGYCAERISAYARAGAQRMFLWPVTDELHQLQLFHDKVAPHITDATT